MEYNYPMIYRYCDTHRMFRHPKTHSEKSKNSTVEHKQYIRAKRRPNNLPDSWYDFIPCKDKDTKRQIRRSKNNFRQSIRKLIGE